MQFRPAQRSQQKLRMVLWGPSKSGKTWTSLLLARRLAELAGTTWAVIDTEGGRSELYAGSETFGDFQVCVVDDHHPERGYRQALHLAHQAGVGVVVIDSGTHAWEAIKEVVDDESTRSKSNNSFAAWSKGTALYKKFVQDVQQYPGHVIMTLRQTTEYELQEDERGKKRPVMIGTKPVQRKDFEYEWDLLCSMDMDHTMRVEGSRYASLDGATYALPGPDFMDGVWSWLSTGEDPQKAAEEARRAIMNANQAAAEKADQDDAQARSWIAGDLKKLGQACGNIEYDVWYKALTGWLHQNGATLRSMTHASKGKVYKKLTTIAANTRGWAAVPDALLTDDIVAQITAAPEQPDAAAQPLHELLSVANASTGKDQTA